MAQQMDANWVAPTAEQLVEVKVGLMAKQMADRWAVSTEHWTADRKEHHLGPRSECRWVAQTVETTVETMAASKESMKVVQTVGSWAVRSAGL